MSKKAHLLQKSEQNATMILTKLLTAKSMWLVREAPAVGPNQDTMFRKPGGRPAYHTIQETLLLKGLF